MTNHTKIPTSPEVYRAIHAQHPDMKVASSLSEPQGSRFGNPNDCQLFTEWYIPDTDYPIVGSRVTWTKDHDDFGNRIDEKWEYWLCIGIEDNE